MKVASLLTGEHVFNVFVGRFHRISPDFTGFIEFSPHNVAPGFAGACLLKLKAFPAETDSA